jgi:hypothetical protein
VQRWLPRLKLRRVGRGVGYTADLLQESEHPIQGSGSFAFLIPVVPALDCARRGIRSADVLCDIEFAKTKALQPLSSYSSISGRGIVVRRFVRAVPYLLNVKVLVCTNTIITFEILDPALAHY